ncbi:hypothetical protein PseAD21_16580 [Pseudomonas sp. AD21]|nr:hypothetical protein PseAD21_16580 [Pseudomonas sp. AD21]
MQGEQIVAVAQREHAAEAAAIRVEFTVHVQHVVAARQVACREQQAASPDRYRVDVIVTAKERFGAIEASYHAVNVERRTAKQNHIRRLQRAVHIQRARRHIDAAETLGSDQGRDTRIFLLQELEVGRVASVERKGIGVVQHHGIAVYRVSAADDVAQHRAIVEGQRVIAATQVDGAGARHRAGHCHRIVAVAASIAAIDIQGGAAANQGAERAARGRHHAAGGSDVQRTAQHADFLQIGRTGAVEVESARTGLGHAFEVDQLAQVGGLIDVVDAGIHASTTVDSADDMGAVVHGEGIVAIAQREGSAQCVERANHV